MAAVALPVALVAARTAPATRGRRSARGNKVPRTFLALGTLAFCAFLLDGAAYTWIAVHLREGGAGGALAAAGVAAFAGSLAGGRLVSDRLVARHGRRAVVAGGALLTAAGAVLALAAPRPGLALAGWAVYGLGLAPLAPAVLGAAGTPAAIAGVTAVGYLGSFSGPPLIGLLAGPFGLTAALAPLAAVALAAAVLAVRA